MDKAMVSVGEAIRGILNGPGMDRFTCEDGVDHKRLSEIRCENFNAIEGDENKVDGYDCPLCKNRGKVIEPVERETARGIVYTEKIRECGCWKVRRSIRRIQRSGLKDVIEQYTFEKYETPEAWHETVKSIAEQFVKDEDAQFFFIGGQSGGGKTHICTAMCNAFMRQRREVRYMLWMDESKELKAKVNEPQYEIDMDRLKSVDVLYIDDFLKTANGDAPTRGDLNLAIELVNSRYNSKGKITIISSEFIADNLLDMDEALMGRIVEACKGRFEINIPKDRKKNWRLRSRITL